jgi:hypothetical protein
MLEMFVLLFVVMAVGHPGACLDVTEACKGLVDVVASDNDSKEVLPVPEDFAMMVSAFEMNVTQMLSPGVLASPVCDGVWVGLHFYHGGFGGWLVTFGHWLDDSWLVSTGVAGQVGPTGDRVQGCCGMGQASSGNAFFILYSFVFCFIFYFLIVLLFSFQFHPAVLVWRRVLEARFQCLVAQVLSAMVSMGSLWQLVAWVSSAVFILLVTRGQGLGTRLQGLSDLATRTQVIIFIFVGFLFYIIFFKDFVTFL